MAINIRRATPSDADAIAAVHMRTWQAAYRGLMPDDFLDTLDVTARADRWRRNLTEPGGDTYVIEDDASISGFGSLLASRDPDASPHTGDLAALYVSPDRWRSGAGLRLMTPIIARAHERSFTALSLWVLEGNTRARRFYEANAFEPDGHAKTDSYGTTTLRGLRYVRALSSSLPA